jgi:Uma2 family endonuclease
MSVPVITKPLSFEGRGPEDFFRFTVPQYHEMVERGILGEDDPAELLDGCLIVKMPKNPSHRFSCGSVRDVLGAVLPEGYFLESQDPITLTTSEPEPDAAVIRGTRRDFTLRHPGPEDTALVIEVSDDSLQRDQKWKRLIYASAGIPVYWIVNLVDRRLEIYQLPTATPEGSDYADPVMVSLSDHAPLVLDGIEVCRIPVRQLFP